jgi:hypothetical protein
MGIKHIPIRTCIATGEKLPKAEMIRLVLQDGIVSVDIKGKLKGRGANIKMDINAFETAVKKKAIARALKLENGLSLNDIERLRKEFIEALDMKNFRKGNKPVTITINKEELNNN